jgi:membrane fusion protein, copper/silver efflux system
MRRSFSLVAAVGIAFVAGYGYGRWYAKDPLRVSAKGSAPSQAQQRYRCPMHPSVKSDRAGSCPECNMALIPVRVAEEFSTTMPSVPSGAVPISAQQEQLIGVKFATVKWGFLSQNIRAVARVGLDETKIAYVKTKLEGYVDEIFVKTVGTEVQKGQVLMTVYHPRSLSAQQEYIDAVKTVMGVPEESAEKAGKPRPPNAEGLMAAARIRLELMGFSETQLDTMTKAMQPMVKLPVVAPISGVVTEVTPIPRQRIVPEALYTIANLSTVWATADLFGYDAGPIEAGQNAVFRVAALQGRAFPAVVDSILPQIDPTTHTRKIRVRIENPDQRLLPDMYGDLEFRFGSGQRALVLPQEAVLDRGVRQIVFLDSGHGYLEPREVKTGRRSGDQIEILHGLRPGERVAASGHFLIDSESRLATDAKDAHDRPGH